MPISEKLSEAATLIRVVAGRRREPESVKASIYRAAESLGWSVSRTKDIWYRAARRVDAEEMDALREAARRRETEATSVLNELQAIVDRAEAILARHKNMVGRSRR